MSVSAAATGNPLPFGWEWRIGSRALVSNSVNERFSFFSFVNTNVVGSTQQYRVIVRNLANVSGAGLANAAFNLITLADTDGDGIPDEWETQFGFNPTNALDRNVDLDGDGLGNWQEYVAGTDPTDANSSLKVSLGLAPGQATVSFGAISNRTYTIQYNDTLGAGPWAKLADIFARTNSRIETVLDANWRTNRFYRAVTPRQPD